MNDNNTNVQFSNDNLCFIGCTFKKKTFTVKSSTSVDSCKFYPIF